MYYQADNYGTLYSNSSNVQFNASICSHVFMNFGQWPLSHVDPTPYGWDAWRYAHAVANIAVSMQQQQEKHGAPHFWLTTGPLPLIDIHQQRNAPNYRNDWRTDPLVMRFNKVASTVMQAHGIPVIDTYSIASPLFDMAYDGAHFIGTVGLAQANMVANLVCSNVIKGKVQQL